MLLGQKTLILYLAANDTNKARLINKWQLLTVKVGWKLLKQLPRLMCVGPARLPTGAAGKMPLSLFCSWRCRNWCECNESWDAGGNSEIVLSSWKPITCSSAAFPDSRFEDKFLPPVIMWGLVNAEHILEIKGKTKKNNLTLLPKNSQKVSSLSCGSI